MMNLIDTINSKRSCDTQLLTTVLDKLHFRGFLLKWSRWGITARCEHSHT